MSIYKKREEIRKVEKLVNERLLSSKGYKILKGMLTSGAVSLDELNKGTRNNVYKKIFYYKFFISCSNAENVRCGKKKGYENVQYKLGSERGLLIRMYKHNPNLAKQGISVITKYVDSGFSYDLAPCIHRHNDQGHYDWDNIEIMHRKDHDKLKAKQEREICNSL